MIFYVELNHRVHIRGLQGRCMGSSTLIWILELLWETRWCVRFQVLLIWSGEHQEQTLGGSESSCSLWGLAVVQVLVNKVLVVNKAKSIKLDLLTGWLPGEAQESPDHCQGEKGEQTVQFILKPHGEGAALGSGERKNWSAQYWPESASFVTRVPLLFLLPLLGLVLELLTGEMFKRKPETIWRQYSRI